MSIHGFHKLSTVDYPKNITSVLFYGGCNFRCPYCHNKELVLKESPPISWEELFITLKSRKKYINCVTLSGGEPSLSPELMSHMKQLKKNGFQLKLDTNGSNPDFLEDVIKNDLVQYIAMDLKTSFSKYHRVLYDEQDLQRVKESAKMIKEKAKDYEFRMTFLKGITNLEDFDEIKVFLKGTKRFRIQKGRLDHKVLDPKFPMEEYLEEEMVEIHEAFKHSSEEVLFSSS